MTETIAPDERRLSGRHLSPVMARYFQRSWTHGEGHYLYDTDGKRYLDFACGIATTVLGHRHPAVTAAIHQQADRLLHGSNGLGYFEPVDRLASLIADALPDPLDAVFFGNSGAEAIEGAIKLARRVTGRPAIIAFSGGFHGRTYGALSATTSNLNYRVGHEPLLPSIYLSSFPRPYREHGGNEAPATEAALEDLRRLLREQVDPRDVAAVLIEPVQGEGGYHPAPVPFLHALRQLCDEHGMLLIADEIQCGYGRTGRMWGFEHAGIVPDVVCLAKAIANGLPLSAIVSARELQERWGIGSHGSTFGGNPVACAAGVAVLEAIRDGGLLENATARGAELSAALRRLMERDDRIGEVRGPGLMIGVELVTDGESRDPDEGLADAVIGRCAEDGLLLLTCGSPHNVVRWIPPLDVTADEVEHALAVFESALAEPPTVRS